MASSVKITSTRSRNSQSFMGYLQHLDILVTYAAGPGLAKIMPTLHGLRYFAISGKYPGVNMVLESIIGSSFPLEVSLLYFLRARLF